MVRVVPRALLVLLAVAVLAPPAAVARPLPDGPVVAFADFTAVPEAPGLVTVPGGTAPVGTGPLRRFAVDVERGVGVDPQSFAGAVQRILLDPRGWTGAGGRLALQRVDAGDVDIRVTLARPRTVDRLCYPLHTAGFADCFNKGRAVINVDRWTNGSVSYTGDLRDYRYYLINHEVGHGLGHGHKYCPGPGRRSFVMMQQTGTTFGCRRQPWPRASEQQLPLVPPRVVVVPGAGDAAAAAGAAFVQALGAPDRRLDVSTSEELRASDLRGTAAVVFIDTGAAPLPSPAVRRALQRFVRAGGGVLALGSSAGGYSGWPWWRRLVAGPPCHRAGKTARVVVDPGGAIATDWAGAPEQTLVARALAWSVGLSEARPC